MLNLVIIRVISTSVELIDYYPYCETSLGEEEGGGKNTEKEIKGRMGTIALVEERWLGKYIAGSSNGLFVRLAHNSIIIKFT